MRLTFQVSEQGSGQFKLGKLEGFLAEVVCLTLEVLGLQVPVAFQLRDRGAGCNGGRGGGGLFGFHNVNAVPDAFGRRAAAVPQCESDFGIGIEYLIRPGSKVKEGLGQPEWALS